MSVVPPKAAELHREKTRTSLPVSRDSGICADVRARLLHTNCVVLVLQQFLVIPVSVSASLLIK
jgi:hypothetical protein